MATAAIRAVFAFVQAISFNAPFAKVKVEPPIAAPFTAVAATVAAKPTGAACTALAETAPAISAADSVTPCLEKSFLNFSSARLTRFLAVSPLTPIAAPTSSMLLPSRKRKTTAFRSLSFNESIADSSSGASCRQAAGSGSFKVDRMQASCSRAWRRRRVLSASAAA